MELTDQYSNNDILRHILSKSGLIVVPYIAILTFLQIAISLMFNALFLDVSSGSESPAISASIAVGYLAILLLAQFLSMNYGDSESKPSETSSGSGILIFCVFASNIFVTCSTLVKIVIYTASFIEDGDNGFTVLIIMSLVFYLLMVIGCIFILSTTWVYRNLLLSAHSGITDMYVSNICKKYGVIVGGPVVLICLVMILIFAIIYSISLNEGLARMVFIVCFILLLTIPTAVFRAVAINNNQIALFATIIMLSTAIVQCALSIVAVGTGVDMMSNADSFPSSVTFLCVLIFILGVFLFNGYVYFGDTLSNLIKRIVPTDNGHNAGESQTL